MNETTGSADVVLIERDGDIATVVLNRPEKLNALNKAMWTQVAEVMREIGADDDVRCVVLRGAGDKAMGPGADISEFSVERANAEQAEAYGGLMHNAMHAIRDCPHPVIAMIKGLCVGGALEIALMCDMRICGEGSRFGVPINRLGLVMAYPEVEALVELVGRSVALEILYEARVFGAAEAREKGLVNRVVADDAVDEEAYATARRIADGAPLVNRWHKKFVDRVLAGGPPLTEAEAKEGFACFDTEDFNIGFKAFLAKEKPEFKGK
ncbi:MAG: enoyl-CoA hydratase [Rhodospirillaceae bacterium]|nr:enoyl-CoA hydratase [Rhodospirillaceae bacterium]|tara:strand:- start:481 stop:1281 length:801 start_codon:yes stop_codon:yes gene_type:complete